MITVIVTFKISEEINANILKDKFEISDSEFEVSNFLLLIFLFEISASCKRCNYQKL